MKKVVFIVLMLLTSTVFAQYMTPSGMIDGATGNLVYTTVNPPPPGSDPISWTGFSNTNLTGGGFSGGYQPGYNPTTGTFLFGYSRGTINYSTPVNYALSSAGTNIQVNGFKYSWEYLNQDYSRGTLTGNINLTSKAGQILENYNYTMSQTVSGWTRFSGTENFSTQYAASTVGNLNVSFTGKDDRYWAGYYGPQIRGIDVSLLYSVAPPPVFTDFPKWMPLSNEGWDFTLDKPGVVRYGANGVYVYHEFQAGTYSCTNGAWGTDPIGGVYKSCSLGTISSPTPTPVTIPTTTTTTTTDTYTTGVALLDPVTTTVTDPVTATTSTSAAVTTTGTTDTSTAPVAATQQSVVSPVVSAPTPVTTSSTTTTASSSTSSSSSTQSTKEVSTSGGSTSLALSVISKNSERDAAGSAVAQSAVAQAQQAAAQAQQDAANVASSAVSNSLSANVVSSGGQQSSGNGIKVNSSNSTIFSLQSNISSIASISGPSLTSSSMLQQNSNSAGSSTTNQQMSTVSTSSQASNTSTVASVALPLVQPQQSVVSNPTQSYSIEQYQTQVASQSNTVNQNTETYSLITPNMLTDKTNPLNDIIERMQFIPQNNAAINMGPVVNTNTQDNELAGGVSLNKMALAPVGYGDYLNFTLRDAAFYAPKEVYKNQRNVDNARVLRQLTNDSRHQEMVEQQYRR
jgi:hypothetical protein